MIAEAVCTPASSDPTYAEVGGPGEQAGPGASSTDTVSEAELTPVHSNYVPGQMEKHLDFLDFNNAGDLVVGCSSLTTRYWTGQLWYYSNTRLTEAGSPVTDPARSVTGVDLETGVVDGRFLTDTQLLVGLDSGALALVTLTKERDGDRLTHYLEVQSPVVEHDDQMLGLDLWKAGGETLAASVGADLRLNVWGPNLTLLHSYLPAHHRLPTGVACSPTEPRTVATASQDGTVKVWDIRQEKPCVTVHRSPQCPPACLTWEGANLVVGTRSGALLTLDPRTPGKEPLITSQFFDREVRRLRWDSARKRLAVTADDSVVKVVEVRDTAVVEVYQDRRHNDYVRGLAWAGDTLWSAGWDTKVLSHTLH